MDNFVHNDYRGSVKGIHAKLFQKAEETAIENGVGVGFGFPNRAGYIIGGHRVVVWVKKSTN